MLAVLADNWKVPNVCDPTSISVVSRRVVGSVGGGDDKFGARYVALLDIGVTGGDWGSRVVRLGLSKTNGRCLIASSWRINLAER
jgi:hypothetical protein